VLAKVVAAAGGEVAIDDGWGLFGCGGFPSVGNSSAWVDEERESVLGNTTGEIGFFEIEEKSGVELADVVEKLVADEKGRAGDDGNREGLGTVDFGEPVAAGNGIIGEPAIEERMDDDGGKRSEGCSALERIRVSERVDQEWGDDTDLWMAAKERGEDVKSGGGKNGVGVGEKEELTASYGGTEIIGGAEAKVGGRLDVDDLGKGFG